MTDLSQTIRETLETHLPLLTENDVARLHERIIIAINRDAIENRGVTTKLNAMSDEIVAKLGRYRDLADAEAAEFRRCSRDNYTVFEPIPGVWHPLVQLEAVKMNIDTGFAPKDEPSGIDLFATLELLDAAAHVAVLKECRPQPRRHRAKAV
jgi:hypothetical protein